jgi:hypothetical protein
VTWEISSAMSTALLPMPTTSTRLPEKSYWLPRASLYAWLCIEKPLKFSWPAKVGKLNRRAGERSLTHRRRRCRKNCCHSTRVLWSAMMARRDDDGIEFFAGLGRCSDLFARFHVQRQAIGTGPRHDLPRIIPPL